MAKAARPRSKSETLSEIANSTGLARKQIAGVFESLGTLIKKDLTKGPGVFAVPGLMKLVLIKKAATKARKGINPFTGEETMFKAKPARKIVRIRPLKALKDMVN